jgi:hypothetical protein
MTKKLSVLFATLVALFAVPGLFGQSAFQVSYTLADGNLRPFTSGTTIQFPSVDATGIASATITILNQGTAPGMVTGISLSGISFQSSGLPVLPATVAAGQSIRFNILFTSAQPGTFSGALSISFTSATISGFLLASANAPNFSVSYTLANTTNSLFNGSALSFPAVDVNATSTASVTIFNQGAGTGTVSSIGVSGTGFQLTGVPALPATVPAGQSLRFNIVFSPSQTGSFSGTFGIAMTGGSISGTLTGVTTSPNFTLSYTLADSVTHALSAGTTITFPSIDINANTTASITILNQGSGAGSLTAASINGTGFQLSNVPLLPATIAAGQSLRIGIVFNPSQSGSFSGTFRLDLTGISIPGSLTAATAASNISLSYIDPDTNNTVPLSNGSTLQFPSTLSGATSNITVVAANSGAGTGFITSVTVASNASLAFQVVNLPSLPASVPPSQQTRFGVRFSPQQQQSFAAVLQVSINGQTTSVNLSAKGTGPQYTYSWANSGTTTALLPGGTLPIADTAVGQSTNVTVSITNAGNGDGQISNVGLTGQGLSLSGLPAGAFTLHANGTQQFTLTFAPQQPGAVKGQLTIGSDTFAVTATGVGSKLTYAYTNTAGSTTVSEGGAIIFPPSQVGSNESLTFSIQNTGTSATTISSIGLATPSSVFSVQQLPSLPLNLNAGASVTFTAVFLPNNTGTLTATLAINSSTFILSGTGTQPAAVPDYQFQGPSGNPQPAQQPAIGLSLASAYPLALQGTLTLTFTSSVFADDPALQLANGGRTINFTLPANTTQALFNGTATSVPLQTGTTAGTVVITPSFAMQGGFNMTPASPSTLTLTVPSSVPQLQSASITSETLNSFTLVLSGYSTSRNLRQMDIQITPKQGQNFSSTHLTLDLTSSASAWFQSAASQAFGGTFLVAIPFNLSNGSTTDDLVHLLQSLNITATNDVGTSTPVSVTIP